MMRPVILSRPEKLAFLLVILVAGGSDTTSSPGCKVAGAPGTLLGCFCPGGNPGSGLADGGALATAGAPGAPGCGGATAMPGGVFWGTTVVPGGGASGCDCTLPGAGTPCPGSGRFGVGNSRPRGRAGAAPDRKRYCRSARAPGAQARSSRRRSEPQNQSGQWFETSRGFKGRI